MQMRIAIVLVLAALTHTLYTKNTTIDAIIDEEIAREIALHSQAPASPEQQRKVGKYVANSIKYESRKLYNAEMRRRAKDRLVGHVRLKDIGNAERPDFIYHVPAWPFYSLFYVEKDLFQLNFQVQYASRAYASNGHSEDLADLIFGEAPITLKDIVLASKLLVDEKLDALSARDSSNVQANTAHYLHILADQRFDFSAKMDREELSINYARHFHNGDISFGFQVPIVRRCNKIKLISRISPENREKLSAVGTNSVKFFDSFEDLEDFLTAARSNNDEGGILTRKNMSFNKRDTEWGIGDVSMFLNTEIKWKRVEWIILGGRAVFPSAQARRNIHKLWDPELGNGGFIDLALYNAWLFSEHRYFNPHVFVEFQASIPADLSRRVPIRKTFVADSQSPGTKVDAFLVFGEQVNYTDEGWSALDTSVRNFPDKSTTIRIRKGPQLFARLGNIFEGLIAHRGTIDVFYDIRVKGRDYLGKRKATDGFDGHILGDNSYQVEHRVGFQVIYPFSGTKRLNAGFLYTFAGRNTPRTLQADLGFYFEF